MVAFISFETDAFWFSEFWNQSLRKIGWDGCVFSWWIFHEWEFLHHHINRDKILNFPLFFCLLNEVFKDQLFWVLTPPICLIYKAKMAGISKSLLLSFVNPVLLFTLVSIMTCFMIVNSSVIISKIFLQELHKWWNVSFKSSCMLEFYKVNSCINQVFSTEKKF